MAAVSAARAKLCGQRRQREHNERGAQAQQHGSDGAGNWIEQAVFRFGGALAEVRAKQPQRDKEERAGAEIDIAVVGAHKAREAAAGSDEPKARLARDLSHNAQQHEEEAGDFLKNLHR